MVIFMAATMVGCGESQEDKIARMMQRRRTPDPPAAPTPIAPASPSDPATPIAPASPSDPVLNQAVADGTPPGKKVVVESTTNQRQRDARTVAPEPSAMIAAVDKTPVDRSADPATDTAAITPTLPTPTVPTPTLDVEIPPIENRTNATSRRDPISATASNLRSIQEAINRYSERGSLPPAHTKTATGERGLSWRVMILPQLGYPKLFAKFDLSKTWDEEPNRSLLSHIPPQYVSPDRVDVKTNYLAPRHRSFGLRNHQAVSKGAVEDGFASTIFVVEADDRFATEWTRPNDFEPGGDPNELDSLWDDIGNLRSEGLIAVWGSGKPTLISKSVSPLDLWSAWTVDDGNAAIVGKIHRSVPIAEPTTTAMSPTATPSTAASTVVAATNVASPNVAAPNIAASSVASRVSGRQPRPASIVLGAAEERLRSAYDDVLQNGRPEQKQRLAKQWITDAGQITADPAGTFAMLRNAADLAASSGDLATAVRADSELIRRFDVSAASILVETFDRFAGSSSNASTSNASTSNSGAAIAPDDASAALRMTLPAVVEVIDQGQWAVAHGLITRAAVIARRGGATDAVAGLNRLTRCIIDAGRDERRVEAAHQRLETDRNDAAAAQQIGRYRCFVRNDWSAGLPLLAGGTGVLQEIAQTDLATGDAPGDQVATGDRWWSLAEKTQLPIYRESAQRRARHWYRKSLDNLSPSLDKIIVEKRLTAGPPPSGFHATLDELADNLGVDLRMQW